MRRLFGGFGYAPAVQTANIEWAWIGNVSASGATIKVRSSGTPTLLYGTTLVDPENLSGTEGNDDIWAFTLTGLSDDTAYLFSFVGWEFTGSFRTFPTEGTAHSFTIVAGGDSGGASADYGGSITAVSNAPTWDRMREHDPLLCLVLGDWHYADLNTSSAASYRSVYRSLLGESRVSQFVREVPTAYVWDDHDFGPNDADGTYAHKATPQAVYREYAPHWTLPDPEEIYHTFVVGRVRFINLDVRSERSPNSATDNSSKTRLGATQKQWLKDTLDAATEPCIVINVVSWIGGTTGFDDGWDSFSTERTELFDFFAGNGHMDKLYLIGADIHELMDDDGSNTNYATTPSGDGPPYAGFAPIDAGFNDFSADPLNKYQTRKQQYGLMTFTDTGSQITVTSKGYALSADGTTSSQVFSRSVVFSG